MFGIELNSNRRRMQKQQQRIAENIQFNQRMRALSRGSKRMQDMIDANIAQAIAAEKEGRHDQAVQLACEVKRMRSFLDSSRSVCGTLERAHAMNETNRAMTDMMKSSADLSDTIMEMADPAVLGEIQAGILTVDENMRYLKEQNDLAYEAVSDCDGQSVSAEGEAYLQLLVDNERKQKKSRLLADTNKQLDRLQRARPMD